VSSWIQLPPTPFLSAPVKGSIVQALSRIN
jgi:hypothetical protein